MRLSEKTVELNFCKGLPQIIGKDIFWFGLTQAQEARAGFDACTKFGGVLLIFQLKASCHVLNNGSRRFLAPHDQMQALRDSVKPKRKIFYVFPQAGTTHDVCKPNCLSHCSQFLDVSKLPPKIPPPLAKGKMTLRANRVHYVDVASGKARIHSEPLDVELLQADQLHTAMPTVERIQPEPACNPKSSAHEFEEFWDDFRSISRLGMIGGFAI